MEKKYKNVASLLNDVSEDKKFNKTVETEINAKKISKTLFSMRCHAGMNQSQVAELMKCTQGKVSKLENALDTDISMGDLMNYCSALNMNIEIGFFDSRLRMVDTIKYHYFRLKGLLDELIETAKGDDVMERGVEKFATEAFFNINFGLIECLEKAKVKKEANVPLHVSTPVNFKELGVERAEQCGAPS